MFAVYAVGLALYIFAWDRKSKVGYWSRFVGSFLITFSILSMYFGFSLASWFSTDWLSGN